MKLTIEPTGTFAELTPANGAGLVARVWDGMTERGARVHVFVATIAAPIGQDNAELDAELIELNLGAARRPLSAWEGTA